MGPVRGRVCTARRALWWLHNKTRSPVGRGSVTAAAKPGQWLITAGPVIGAGSLGVIRWAEHVHTEAIAHTMGVVTFSLYALFFSITTKDERRTVFSLDTFADKTFNIATGVSVLTLLLATVFGPLEAFLKTSSLDVQQWLVCTGVALSIIVVSEIRKAVRRRTAA